MRQIFRIIKFTGELWPFYAAAAFFGILVALTMQAQPLLVRAALDEVAKVVGDGQASVNFVLLLALAIFAADVGQTLFQNIGGYIGDILGARLKKLMSQRYFAHLLTLPQIYYDRELSGKILNRLNRGVDQIGNYVQALANNFLPMILGSIVSFVIIFAISWPVGLMLLTLYPVIIYLTVRTSSRWMEYQKEINTNLDTATGRFSEVINQIKIVKSFRRADDELKLFTNRFQTVIDTTKPQSNYWHRRDVYRRLALNVIFLAVYAYIFAMAAQGHYSVGTMVLLIMYATNIRMPLFSISFIIDLTQRAVANTKDYFEVIDQQPEIVDRPNAKKLNLTDGRVVFSNVKFDYDNDKPVFKGLNFELEPDSKNALVGESGSGKTTITNLLLRLYDIDSGQIEIDGQDISDVTQASLHSQIGVVFQEPALFSGTIRENIAYANPKASLKQVIKAAKAANAHEFIEKFSDGYNSEIGERGLKLSGGQKQRIAIARALLKDAPILILDEATSSLDTKSERLVQQALERLMKNRTTLIVAHRLSTIQSVDKVITIKNGKVNEVGSPAQLAKSDGIYAELLSMQEIQNDSSEKKLKKFDLAA